jgi:COP9 signalosome complex subunit 1
MGHNDLGHFYRSHGDHATALRHYTKSREFCTSSFHVVDMCVNILEVLSPFLCSTLSLILSPSFS